MSGDSRPRRALVRNAFTPLLALALTALLALALAPIASGGVHDVNVAGQDFFPSGGEIELELQLPGQKPLVERIELTSQGLPDAVINRGALTDSHIDTEIVQLDLAGQSSLGQVFVRAGSGYGLPASTGRIDNVKLDRSGGFESGDSFFDVFVEIQVIPRVPAPGQGPGDIVGPPIAGPIIAQNATPLRLQTTISKLPPNYPEKEPKAARAINHFKCYVVVSKRFSITATLSDQFESRRDKILRPVRLCNPVSKNGEGFQDTSRHLVCYAIDKKKQGFEKTAIGIHNQFGDETVDATARETLCVPSTKKHLQGPRRRVPRGKNRPLGHYKCYTITSRNPLESRTVRLEDQFESHTTKTQPPDTVCNPVRKVVKRKIRNRRVTVIGPIRNQAAHLVTYRIPRAKNFKRRVVEVTNQFGKQRLVVRNREKLMVPTHKTPCSEYAEETKAALMAQGQQVGTIHMAIHVPFEGRDDAGCP